MKRITQLQLGLARTLRVPALVARYIRVSGQKFAARSEPLDAARKTALQGFFSPVLLERVKVAVVHDALLNHLPYRRLAGALAVFGLHPLSHIAAITFRDVIVFHQEIRDAVLFHELVHVEQFRQLGLRRFAELYVRGFITGGNYRDIPLETCAYELAWQYELNPGEIFSVAEKVDRWIHQERF